MTPDLFAKEKTTLVFDLLGPKRMQVLDLEPFSIYFTCTSSIFIHSLDHQN